MHTGEHSEGNGATNYDDSLVDTQSHLLGGSEQEVLELGSIQDEKHHTESDSDDLDDQEHHDTLGGQPTHVVE